MLRSILRAVHPVRFNHVRVPQLADTELREQTISRLRTFTSGASAPASTSATPTQQGVVSPDEFRKREEMVVKMPPGVALIDPIQRFADAPEAIRRCDEMCKKFPSPTSIQAQAWPIALAGHDLVSIARTGSGKTLGFLIPVFNHIAKLPRPTTRGYGPVAVILAPTRELAQQIEAEAKQYSNFPLLCAFGGVSKSPQVQKLRQGVDIIVATPGRLNDLLSMDFPATNLDRCSFLVLDEADRMLDMGFEPQLRDILNHMNNNKRQTLMFSATWPKEVRSLAMDFLNNPAQINIGGTEMNVCPDVHQKFHLVESGKDKAELLLSTLKDLWEKNPRASVMLFVNTKLGAEQVVDYIKQKTNTRAFTIHGDKSQEQRDFALSEFRAGRAPLLVCTDVASRGIDVKNVGCVINYEFPMGGTQDWIHRVGRTGRQGTKGQAVTFLSASSGRYAAELALVLSKAKQEVPDWLGSIAGSGTAQRGGGRSGSFRSAPNRGSSQFGGNRFGGNRFGAREDSQNNNASFGYGSNFTSDSGSSNFTRPNSSQPPSFAQPGSGFKRANSGTRRLLDPEDRPMRRINLGSDSSA